MAGTAAQRGREVRQRLLAAAAELIAERGWTAVSSRVVAERAGVTAGVVHYHFTSMAALLADAALSMMRAAVAEVSALLDRAETPEQALDLMLAELDRYTGRDPVSVLFVETYLAATRDEALRRAVAGIVEEFRRRLAGWLTAHGVAEPEATAAVLAAGIDGVLLHRALSPELTTATVAPVLRRVLTPARGRRK